MNDIPIAIEPGPLATTAEDPVEILLAAARRYDLMHPYGCVEERPTMEDDEPFGSDDERQSWADYCAEWDAADARAAHIRGRLFVKALVEGALALRRERGDR